MQKPDLVKIFIAIVFISVIAVGFILSGQPTTDNPVASSQSSLISDLKSVNAALPGDWRVYQNQEYGFELKYPPGWTAKGFQQTGGNQFYFVLESVDSAAQKVQPFTDRNAGVIIQIFKPSLAENIQGRTCKRVYTGKNKNNCITQYIQFNGIEAIRKVYNVPEIPAIIATDIDFVRDGVMYHFYTSAYGQGESLQDVANQVLVLDRIISTFNFL